MKNQKLSIFAAFLLPLSLFSQQGFAPGYIIGTTGDTIRGEVKVNEKKPQEHYLKVMFRDDKGMQKTFKPNKIKGYGFKESNFIAYGEGEEATFYKALVQGPVSLYELVYEGLRMNKVAIETEYFLALPGSKHLDPVKERNFRKQLTGVMADNPTMAEQYPEDKQFDADAATATIKEYNAWKSGQN